MEPLPQPGVPPSRHQLVADVARDATPDLSRPTPDLVRRVAAPGRYQLARAQPRHGVILRAVRHRAHRRPKHVARREQEQRAQAEAGRGVVVARVRVRRGHEQPGGAAWRPARVSAERRRQGAQVHAGRRVHVRAHEQVRRDAAVHVAAQGRARRVRDVAPGHEVVADARGHPSVPDSEPAVRPAGVGRWGPDDDVL